VSAGSALAEGALLGLASTGHCLGVCGPALLPLITTASERGASPWRTAGLFQCGRAAGYAVVLALAAAIGFENFASGYGGVVVVAYLSALCNLRYTAAQYALVSAAASVVGRVLTGATAGGLIESLGYVQFYLLTTLLAVPGVLLFWWMWRRGTVDEALGTAGRDPDRGAG